MYKVKIISIHLLLITIFLVHFTSSCQSSYPSTQANTNQSNSNAYDMTILDSLFMESNFEELTQILSERTKLGDTNALNYLSYISYIADTLAELTKDEILSKSYIVSIENIKLLDDLDYYLSHSDLDWNSFSKEISKLKCQFNTALQKQFNSDIDKAHKLFKSASNIALAGQLIGECQFYRLKFFRDTCFDKLTYDISVKKIIEVSNWIEKSIIDNKYQEISDNQPEWVKKGMSYDEWFEWRAQNAPNANFSNSSGKSLYRGKRGGIYTINSNGKKQYQPRH
ncbi:MAG: hypothetical protein ACKO7P_09140 [Bacteroidota bacterium]